MKKMISCLTAFALITSVPTATVFAADTTATVTTEANEKSEIAVARLKNMNAIFSLTDGAESNLNEYVKVEDERFKTIESVKTFITENCTGKLREQLLKSCDSCLKEENGALYKKISGRFFFTFLTDNGVAITDQTDESFSAVTLKDDQMNDYGRAKFELDDGKWKISDYEFGFFTANNSAIDLEGAACSRIFNLQSILHTLSYGAPVDSEDTIIVNDEKYGKASEDLQPFLLDYFKEYIKDNCTGELCDSLIKQIENRFIEKDGVVYAIIGARGAYDFNISNGVVVSDVSENGFTATTISKSDKDGFGRVHFIADGGKWLVKSYEFVDTNDAFSYTLGDINSDGSINAVDASSALSYYALTSTSLPGGFDNNQKLAADVDHNGNINAVDASYILSYYAYISTSSDKSVSLEEFLNK